MFIDLSMKHIYIGTCLHILVYITSILLHVLIRAWMCYTEIIVILMFMVLIWVNPCLISLKKIIIITAITTIIIALVITEVCSNTTANPVSIRKLSMTSPIERHRQRNCILLTSWYSFVIFGRWCWFW